MSEMADIQWFPGHMAKTRRMIQSNLSLVDGVVEILDARIPESSRNPEMDRLVKGKPRMFVLNKADMADDNATVKWLNYYKSKGFTAIKISCKSGNGLKNFLPAVKEQMLSELMARRREKGIENAPLRLMIVGIPNAGKSTFINRMAKSKKAKAEDRPGVTRTKQWVKLGDNVEMLDMPGVLWPKFEDQTVGLRLAFIGSIKDELSNQYELCLLLMKYLQEHYPEAVPKAYQIEADDSEVVLLERVAKRRGCLKAGGEYDLDKAANYVIDDFRNGRLGAISLEQPEQ